MYNVYTYIRTYECTCTSLVPETQCVISFHVRSSEAKKANERMVSSVVHCFWCRQFLTENWDVALKLGALIAGGYSSSIFIFLIWMLYRHVFEKAIENGQSKIRDRKFVTLFILCRQVSIRFSFFFYCSHWNIGMNVSRLYFASWTNGENPGGIFMITRHGLNKQIPCKYFHGNYFRPRRTWNVSLVFYAHIFSHKLALNPN